MCAPVVGFVFLEGWRDGPLRGVGGFGDALGGDFLGEVGVGGDFEGVGEFVAVCVGAVGEGEGGCKRGHGGSVGWRSECGCGGCLSLGDLERGDALDTVAFSGDGDGSCGAGGGIEASLCDRAAACAPCDGSKGDRLPVGVFACGGEGLLCADFEGGGGG